MISDLQNCYHMVEENESEMVNWMIIDFNKSWPRVMHNLSEMTAVTLGLFLNTVLIVVVQKQKEPALISFGKIVFINCIMDYFLTCTTLIGGVQTDGQDGAMFLVADSWLASNAPERWHFWINYLWCVGLGFSILYQPIPFYHRYRAICKNDHMSFCETICLTAIPMSCCIWNTSWMVYGMSKIDKPREKYSHLLNDPIWTAPDGKIPIFTISDARHWQTWIFYTSCTITFPLATGSALFFYSLIHRQLVKSMGDMSEKTQKLQKQLNRALLSQTIFPFLFGILPMVVFMGFLLLRTKFHIASIVCTSLFSWIPVINPLLNICLVTAYRRTIVQMFFFWRKDQHKIRAVSTTNSDGFKTKTMTMTNNTHDKSLIIKDISSINMA